MKSLYIKVLVWSIATVMVAMAGLFVQSRFAPRRGGPLFQSARILADIAHRIYVQEGAEALQEFVRRSSEGTDTDLFVTGPNGRDLISGADRSDMLRQPQPGPPRYWPFAAPPPRFVLVAPSSDNSIRLLLVANQFETSRSPFPESLIWVLAAVSLLAYLFTFYLVSPLRKLAAVVERFGSGELTARARTNRGDELGHLARAFDSMAGRIDTLVTTERRLLQDISHELRTPLSRMRFAVEVARTDPDRQAALDRIRKECDRLALLTDELLEIGIAEGDPSQRNFERQDLADLLREIVDDASIESEALVLHAPSQLMCRVDRELLRRAVDNIVRNAIRHSPAGEKIDIGLAVQAGEAVITVRDRGPGVPAEMLEKIFQPFFRADSHRARAADSGGVGLGLAIARRAVQWHHGTIHAENAAPGLRVTFTLPA